MNFIFISLTFMKFLANLKKTIAQFLQPNQHALFFLMNAFDCTHVHPAG